MIKPGSITHSITGRNVSIASLFTRAVAVALLGAAYPAAHAEDAHDAAASSTAAPGCTPGSENESFWQRLADSYQAHLFPRNASAPVESASAAPPSNDPHIEASGNIDAGGYRRGLQPPPLTVPPWPYSTWPMGGTPTIGYENMYYGPVMDALWCGRNGKKLEDSRYNPTATPGAGKQTQLILAADLILHF